MADTIPLDSGRGRTDDAAEPALPGSAGRFLDVPVDSVAARSS
jgi:hypothetical protein